jgi:hypothetical protein
VARENRTWSIEHMLGELLVPGVWVAKSTFQMYIEGAGRTQCWSIFLDSRIDKPKTPEPAKARELR